MLCQLVLGQGLGCLFPVELGLLVLLLEIRHAFLFRLELLLKLREFLLVLGRQFLGDCGFDLLSKRIGLFVEGGFGIRNGLLLDLLFEFVEFGLVLFL